MDNGTEVAAVTRQSGTQSGTLGVAHEMDSSSLRSEVLHGDSSELEVQVGDLEDKEIFEEAVNENNLRVTPPQTEQEERDFEGSPADVVDVDDGESYDERSSDSGVHGSSGKGDGQPDVIGDVASDVPVEERAESWEDSATSDAAHGQQERNVEIEDAMTSLNNKEAYSLGSGDMEINVAGKSMDVDVGRSSSSCLTGFDGDQHYVLENYGNDAFDVTGAESTKRKPENGHLNELGSINEEAEGSRSTNMNLLQMSTVEDDGSQHGANDYIVKNYTEPYNSYTKDQADGVHSWPQDPLDASFQPAEEIQRAELEVRRNAPDNEIYSEGDMAMNEKQEAVTGYDEQSVKVEDVIESSYDEDDARASVQQNKNVGPTVRDTPSPSLPSVQSHPAGLGSSAALLEPSSTHSAQQSRANRTVSQRQYEPVDSITNGEGEEYDETREKLQMIRVKFLRLATRLGQTPHNVVVAQVLYRLGLAEQLRSSSSRSGAFNFDRASAVAEQLEAAGQEPLDFSCTVMVIGKTGVGKSATINSIFGEVMFQTGAFESSTKKVQDVVGTVQGIQLRIIDTPGLLPSSSDQPKNEKILTDVKCFIKKSPPDVIMYLDRLDMQSRDLGDVPLLHSITNVFGPSIWFNAIVVLTHAASAPPEGPNGNPLSYEMYVTQRSHVIQQAIRQAAGDPRLLNPVSLVENHSACRMNRAGQRVLPNGQVWKPHLLLLSFASKILTEANTLLKLQDSPISKQYSARTRAPPLPFLLSSLLQSRPQPKLPEEQFSDDDTLDVDVDEESGSDDEGDYDELPPFKRLTKEQLSKLSKSCKKAYYKELDYREKLFFKKQMKEERKRRRLLKHAATAASKDLPNDYRNDSTDENYGPASLPVPMPDLTLPASFDSDYPSYRYRFLDTSQWLVRPVLETQGWDHDVGYEGLNAERLLVLKDKVPISVSGQLTKDKKECNLQMEMAGSIKHCEGNSSSLGLDMQTVGKDMAYTLRGETKFMNFKQNSTTAGISATVLGDSVSAGFKIEDKLVVKRRLKLLLAGGAMTARGDVAYGGRLEATLRDKYYPLGRSLLTLALSVVDWHGDLAIGCNVQSQMPIGRNTNLIGNANLSNRGTGQIGIRLNSSEHIQLALVVLLPILRNAKRLLFGSSEPM